MMHQHMQHDVLRHACGEIAHRDTNQRHVGQTEVGHQRIDACAKIENDAQVRKFRQFTGMRLPDRRVVHLGRIDCSIRQQHDAPVSAHIVEAGLPPFGRPVFSSAVHQQC